MYGFPNSRKLDIQLENHNQFRLKGFGRTLSSGSLTLLAVILALDTLVNGICWFEKIYEHSDGKNYSFFSKYCYKIEVG